MSRTQAGRPTARALALTLLLALLLPASGAAQESGPLIRYGKWVLAAGAVTMNLLAAQAHSRADRAYDAIEDAFLRILRARYGLEVETVRDDRSPLTDRQPAAADDDGLKASA